MTHKLCFTELNGCCHNNGKPYQPPFIAYVHCWYDDDCQLARLSTCNFHKIQLNAKVKFHIIKTPIILWLWNYYFVIITGRGELLFCEVFKRCSLQSGWNETIYDTHLSPSNLWRFIEKKKKKKFY